MCFCCNNDINNSTCVNGGDSGVSGDNKSVDDGGGASSSGWCC